MGASGPRRADRALIVGAGVGGLAAAIGLRAAGWEVTVLERAPQLQEVGAGLAVGPNAMGALELLGAGEDARRAGSVLEHLQHRTAEGKLLADWPTGVVAKRIGAPILGMARPALLRLLAARVDAEDIRLGADCVGVEARGEGVVARLAGGAELEGTALVAADGVHSTVRPLYDQTQLRYAGFTEWRGIAPFEGVEKGVHVQSYGPGTVFGWVPLPDEMVAWYGRRNAEPGGSDEPGQSKRVLLDLFGGWHDRVPGLIEATQEESIARADIFDMPRRDRWGAGRVTLLGDAAHPTTPTLGQGAGLAIEDGVVLGRCAERSPDAEQALREYERRRIERTARVVDSSRSQGAMDRWERPVACRVRNLMLRSLPKPIALRQFQKVVTFEP